MWPESVASRGSQEIGSCLLKFMKEWETIAKHLIVWYNHHLHSLCGHVEQWTEVDCRMHGEWEVFMGRGPLYS